ncbi:MAG: NusG domain II-containing protein [Defluviitaleaceae bacterium]|nr:NusG domain II-containing protein [Defluviitaleaceae bacterium]
MTKILRRTDIAVIVSFLLFAIALLIIFFVVGASQLSGGNVHVIITVDGRQVHMLDIDQYDGQTIVVETERGSNTIHIENGVVRMTHADCPDLVCVQTPAVRRALMRITCLPNRVNVWIESIERNPNEPDIWVKNKEDEAYGYGL